MKSREVKQSKRKRKMLIQGEKNYCHQPITDSLQIYCRDYICICTPNYIRNENSKMRSQLFEISCADVSTKIKSFFNA